ncbi:MAG: hypothetical protein U9R57_17795 [Thermodesulfobacteriota bacterium]|nr:hypothetical protein [Thermodesulfobacteriota bacterium]
MAMVMADEKKLLDMEASIERHDDMMALGRRILEEYEAVQKDGHHAEKNDFIVMLKPFELEALQYVSKVLSEEDEQNKQNQMNDLKVYGKELAGIISNNFKDQPNSQKESAPESITLEELIIKYIDHKKRKNQWKSDSRTLSGKTRQLNVIKEFLGHLISDDNPMIHMFVNEHALQFEEKFKLYPANCKKKYPNKSMQEIMAMIANGKISPDKRISTRTYNSYAELLTGMFNWAKSNKREQYLSGDNPFVDMKQAVKQHSKRNPFTPVDLTMFFSSDMYTKKQFEKRFSWRYWVPILMLYHGTRVEELCQLPINHIEKKNGIWCFVIKAEVDKSTGTIITSTKTGDRIVPLHPTVIDIGFLKYVKNLQNDGHSKLFPNLSNIKKSTGGYKQAGSTVSKWFNE